LPFTFLLIAVVVYWLTVIAGVVGVDSLDVDIDADADVDVGIDGDLDADADAGHHGHTGGTMGAFQGFLVLINAHHVPLLIVLSFFIASMWTGSMLGNYYL